MSLRKGHFKKVMYSPEQLMLEANVLHPQLLPILSLWKNQKITDAEMAGLYLITYVRQRHPHHWISGKLNLTHPQLNSIKLSTYFNFSPQEKKKINEQMSLSEFLSIYSLRSVPKAVNVMMIEWIKGLTGLILLEDVPLPKVVLKQQQQGKRCATMITDHKKLGTYILGERDPLGFLIHDLQHAERFFSHKNTQRGQMGFYHFIETFLELDEIKVMMKEDAQFCQEFEYAMSDMNAYCVHLLKYLTSAFSEACKRHAIPECPFLKTVEQSHYSNQVKSLIKQVYAIHPLSTEETLILQNFFENFSEREHASQENTAALNL